MIHPGTRRNRGGGRRILGRTRGVEPTPPLELLDRYISVICSEISLPGWNNLPIS